MKACVTSHVRNYTVVSFSLTIVFPHILVAIPQNNAKMKTKLFEFTKLYK